MFVFLVHIRRFSFVWWLFGLLTLSTFDEAFHFFVLVPVNYHIEPLFRLSTNEIMSSTTVTLGASSSSSLASAFSNSAPPQALKALEINVTDDTAAAGYSPMDLSAWPLQDQATVTLRIAPTVKVADVVSKIHTSFLLAGLQAVGESKLDDGTRVVTAVKKDAASKSAPIRLNLDDDMIDEDNLLADASNVLAPPPAMSDVKTKDDCAGREPCADCTCGRSENKAGDGKQEVKTSSCGKCHLGDAFRCASCPYLGKPAFKPGEEHLYLDLQDDL